MKKYHYTYFIYCLEPKSSMYGCIYYGKHSTNDLLDGYITSGKKILRYINKYPNGYYRKILHLYNSEDEVNEAEYDLIHPHLDKEYCLNMMEGGKGGVQGIETRIKISQNTKGKNKGKTPWNKGKTNVQVAWNKGLSTPLDIRNKISEKAKGRCNKTLSNYNKEHNIEKNKRNKTGVKMMNNGIINKQVHKEEFDLYLSKGFVFGMIRNK